MKLKSIFSILFVALVLSSCGSASKLAQSLDYKNGSKAGTVLTALATQYLTTGKLDLNNAQNILNLMTLSDALSSLKSDSDQAKEDFGKGLMVTAPVVNDNNVGKVVDALSLLSNMDLQKITDSMQKGKSGIDSSLLSAGMESVLKLLGK